MEEEEEDDDDDPNAIDPSELGIYTDEDYKCMSDEDMFLESDPNILGNQLEYVTAIPVNEEGVEIGWDPIFGSSNPTDERTIVTSMESYMVDPNTRNESMLTNVFVDASDDNPEVPFNRHVTRIRKDMRVVDTYTDPWLDVDVPRNVAKWYGHPEELSFPKQDFMNNRFTKPEDKTDFTVLPPFRARKKAVEMARQNNNEWLPAGKSHERKRRQQQSYKDNGTLVGSLRHGEKDPAIVDRIQPCLKVLGSCAELLQIYGEKKTVFRFHYKGAMKNRRGMSFWTETMIRDCGVECTGVLFETGGRLKDKHD